MKNLKLNKDQRFLIGGWYSDISKSVLVAGVVQGVALSDSSWFFKLISTIALIILAYILLLIAIFYKKKG